MNTQLPVTYPPDPNPRKPSFALPPKSCDAHFHILGPPDRFPFAETRVYTPPAAVLQHFLNLMEVLGIERGVVVQPSAHGFDNSVTLDAIAKSVGRFRGVAKVNESFTDDDLDQLHRGGIRGVRFNLITDIGGGVDLPMFERVIARIARLGWSVTFHTLPDNLVANADWFRHIEIPLIIDHFGRVDFIDGPEQEPFRMLVDLVKQENIWAKISCAERQSAGGPPYHDAIPFAQALIDAAPDRILWGTDWPHSLRFGPGQIPNDGDLVDLLLEMAPDEEIRHKILVENPARLFGFDL
jgi:predicted TIM-barrel fold metal-dependent hydrolase